VPPEGTLFAEDIRVATPPGAVILHAPTYNSEVYLTGRRTVVGYLGHIWSQGLDSGTREEDVKRIYAGAPGSRELLARYGVDIARISRQTGREVPGPIDPDELLVHAHRDQHPAQVIAQFLGSRLVQLTGREGLVEALLRRVNALGEGAAEMVGGVVASPAVER